MPQAEAVLLNLLRLLLLLMLRELRRTVILRRSTNRSISSMEGQGKRTRRLSMTCVQKP